ncbi:MULTISPECIES: VCBS repeat domain-containing M23 family metallopeptidase [Microbacterium]|uniref:VCBS repeat domain-containing M23 family metallopeptidase n=1 Tax=Microbacterium TaxID=33882 RepID=UPI0011EAC0CC|nr:MULTISPECIES: VCBS repeat domain-containing M23 family metallopeptidase [Microbacterium]
MKRTLARRRARFGILAALAVVAGALVPLAADGAPAQADYGAMVHPASGTILSRVDDGCGNPRTHAGIDISYNANTPVVAAYAGKVITRAFSAGYGNYMVIEHSGGYTTLYAHMATAGLVAEGQTVSTGQQIGVVGSTGNSTGPHLHFEMRRNGDKSIANLGFTCQSTVTRGTPIPMDFPGLGGPAGPSSVKFDINGDVKADMLAVRNDGYLVIYFGDGAGGTMLTHVGGPGWATTAALVTGDFNGDGAGDFMQTRTDGGLYFYKGNHTSTFTPTYLGPGWNTYSLVTGGVDFNGDGRRDIVARGSNSNLYLYPGDGQGSFGAPTQIGVNWSAFDKLIAGDFDKNGRGDLIARNTAGELWAYYGTATGLSAGQKIGQGWSGFTTILSNGDHNGDGNPDIIARRASDQTLWLYPGNGAGTFGNGAQIGSGWGAYPLIS